MWGDIRAVWQRGCNVYEVNTEEFAKIAVNMYPNMTQYSDGLVDNYKAMLETLSY